MKRIIFSAFDDYTSTRRGGSAIAAHEVAKRLVKDYQVLVIAAKRDGSHDCVIDGVQYMHIGISFGDMRLRQFIYLLFLPFHAIFRKYDAWIETFTGPISTAFLPLFTKRPIIGVTYFFNGDEMRLKYGLPFDWIERVGIKTFNYIIALTGFQREKALKMNADLNVRVIPCGVDDRFRLIQRNPKDSLLYIGRMEVHMKGLDMLIDSVTSVLLRNETIRLVLAGKGSESDRALLEKKVLENKLERQTIFSGYVDEAEKDRLLSEALLFLTPSRFETFGISLLEAMSSGVPAVVFDIPDFGWIPNDCVVKVPQFDVRKYADAVRYLLENATERESLGRRGKEFAQKFSWDEVAKGYRGFIEHVTGSNE